MTCNSSLLSDATACELQSICDGAVEFDVASAKFVTLRAGGALGSLVTPETVDSLRNVLRYCYEHQIPVFSLGKGSNLLVKDEGFCGVAIRTEKCCNAMRIDGERVTVGAGIALPSFANESFRHGLSGAEWAIGVPGTIGGAVCMNAGCHGVETMDYLFEVQSLTRTGDLVSRFAADCDFAHRTSCYQRCEEIVIQATFDLHQKASESIRATMQEYLAYRRRVQPTGTANCGSTFRNPEGHSAWRLIQESGLGGFRVGEAVVSEKHNNFIINEGNASGSDILSLIQHVRTTVNAKFGVTLVPELRVLGSAGFEAWATL